MKLIASLLNATLLLAVSVPFIYADSPELHLDRVEDGFDVTTTTYVMGYGDTRSPQGTCEVYTTDDGALHLEVLKKRDEDGEWYDNRGVFAMDENLWYHTMTLDAELARLPGDGFAEGAGVIVFGYRDVDNYYMLHVTRSKHLMALTRFRDGQWEQVFPPPGHPSGWESVPTTEPPLLGAENSAASDWINVITEDIGGGQTRLQVGVNRQIVIDTIIEGYGGGSIGFGARTFGYSAHAAVTKLHAVPFVHYD